MKFFKKTSHPPSVVSANKDPKFGTREMRQYFRIDVEIPVFLVPIHQGANDCGYCHEKEVDIPLNEMLLQSVNISGSGMYTIWKHPFDIGSHVAVFMVLKGVKDDGMVVCGEVVRNEQIGKNYGVALKFLCRRDFKRELIIRFVSNTERELAQKRVGWIR